MAFSGLVLAWLLLMQQHDVDDAVVAAAKAAKANDVEAAKAAAEKCNDRLKAAVKSRDMAAAKRIRAEASAASVAATRAKNRPLDEYIAVAAAAAERAKAAAAVRARRLEDELRLAERQAATRKKVAEEKRRVGPVFIESAVVVKNVIGLPEINLGVTNNSEDVIEAFDFEVECFTAFDEPVKSIYGSNVCTGACTSPIPPGEEKLMTVQLSLHGSTAKALVRVTRAKAGSGKVWEQTREEAKAINGAIFTAKPPRGP